MSVIEYEEIRLMKQSDKSTVHLVRQGGGERLFVRKVMQGRHDIYKTLESMSHPYLTKILEVDLSEDATVVIEEYVEGSPMGEVDLTEKGVCTAIKELCSVLEYLHGEGIVHRDVKPSNILLAGDGHIRLIDFDAARMIKEDTEQDTNLLGTQGYAPPEQYGFSQTDARADIYALGVTIEKLLGYKARRLKYRSLIRKCTELNPVRRYQSAKEVKRSILFCWHAPAYFAAIGAVLLLICGALYMTLPAISAVEGNPPRIGIDQMEYAFNYQNSSSGTNVIPGTGDYDGAVIESITYNGREYTTGFEYQSGVDANGDDHFFIGQTIRDIASEYSMDIGDVMELTANYSKNGATQIFTITLIHGGFYVEFDSNGGAPGSNGSTIIGGAFTDGDGTLGQELNSHTAKRPGHSFVGWYTERTGGEEITTDYIFIEDMTLFAHWREIA